MYDEIKFNVKHNAILNSDCQQPVGKLYLFIYIYVYKYL